MPSYLRDRHRPGSDEYGPYLYPHNYPEAWVEQEYLPEGLGIRQFYHPKNLGAEAALASRHKRVAAKKKS